MIQCIRAYFSNRFRLRHRAVQDPVEYRNIGKRNQVATSYQDRREDQQESRVDNLHDVYDDLLKATSSDFQGSDDKRAAVDFRSIGRRSFNLVPTSETSERGTSVQTFGTLGKE